MSKQATQTKTALPEGLDGAEVLPKATREAMVEEYVAKQREKFEKRIADRAKRYEEKLKDKASTDRELIVKRLMLQKLQAEVKERRDTIKEIRAEIKQIKEQARQSKKGRTTKKAS